MRMDSKLLDQERQNLTPNLLILLTRDSNLAHAAEGGSNSLFGLTEIWTQ